MSELIDDKVKSEFKRFFEYAFKFKPEYWQELSGWRVLGKQPREVAEDIELNKLITSVIRSEEHLKRIMSDTRLDTAIELKYYAYLFLQDMGKADGLQERKLPETPEQFIEIYDSPLKLLDFIRNSSNAADLRQQALARLKEVILWCKELPERVFDREVFSRNKWNKWLSRGNGYDGLGGYKNIDRNFYYNKIKQYSESSSWDAVDLYVEGYVQVIGAKPTDAVVQPSIVQAPLSYDSLIERLYKILRSAPNDAIHADLDYEEYKDFAYCRLIASKNKDTILAILSRQIDCPAPGVEGISGYFLYKDGRYYMRRSTDTGVTNMLRACLENLNAKEAHTAYQQKLEIYNRLSSLVDNKYNEYRKQQDEEFPALLSQYEKSLALVSFPEDPLAYIKNFDNKDHGFIVVEDKLGQVAEELWKTPAAIKKAILSKDSKSRPDYPFKAYLYKRLRDIDIITLKERRELLAEVLALQLDIVAGDRKEIPFGDNVIDILAELDEENVASETNHKLKDDL